MANESTRDDQISPEQMDWEIPEVHRLDQRHIAIATTFDGWNVLIDWVQLTAPMVLMPLRSYPSGHPANALDAGDALGLDIYLDSPSTPLRFATIALRLSLKLEAVRFWSLRAEAQGKDLWLTELQAQPWATARGGFTAEDLVESAVAYRHEGLGVVLLSGVDTWLKDPAWMRAAISATEALRSP